MAILRLEPHPVAQSWSASGPINLELSPKPYTITALLLMVRADITTTTATNFNDYWDRIIARLNLSGRGKTFFDFSNLRAAYHLSRMVLRQHAPRRPTVIADTQTNAKRQFAYLFHFGVRPFRVGPSGQVEYNPWDLTGGIPPVESGNLSLGGTFAAAGAMGTNVTINDADFDAYLFGVQAQAGDPISAWMPQAIPVWSMRSPTPTATSSAFATQDNIPAGDHLHSMLVMTTRGANSPRADDVLNSLEVYHQLESRSILKFGGQASTAADHKAAEIISQLMEIGGAPASDDVTVGVPAITQEADRGLVFLPLHKFANRGHALYGVDLRSVATGDLQLRYGVANATTVTMDVVYRRYQLNPEYVAA